MPYTKTVWIDREVEKPLTYEVTQNTATNITLTPTPGTIISAGEAFTAAKLNNIELHLFLVNNIFPTLGPKNVYTVALTGVTTLGQITGIPLKIKINIDADAASTLNPAGLGAISLKKANGVNIANFKANGIYTVVFDGTSAFILQGEGGSGNAIASDLLSGKTASTDAGDITGSMPNKVGSATIITPSTVDQAIPQGYFGGVVGDGKVLGDADLIGANILSGKNIFNVAGLAIDGAGMKKFATGTVSPGGSYVYVSFDGSNSAATAGLFVSGLSFTPSVIFLTVTYSGIIYTIFATSKGYVHHNGTTYYGNICQIYNYSNYSLWRFGGSGYLTSGGFNIPSYVPAVYTWFAWE